MHYARALCSNNNSLWTAGYQPATNQWQSDVPDCDADVVLAAAAAAAMLLHQPWFFDSASTYARQHLWQPATTLNQPLRVTCLTNNAPDKTYYIYTDIHSKKNN